MSDEKFVRLRRHPVAKDLSHEALHEIADAATMIEIDTGQYLHRATDKLNDLYLVLQGRLKLSTTDIHGNVLVQRFLARGDQFGALAAAQMEPVPVDVVATEPSKLIRLDYSTALSLGAKHPRFQLNLLKLVGDALRQTIFVDRLHPQPSVIAIIHQSTFTRSLTGQLLHRLVELEDSVCVLTDQSDWKSLQGVEKQSLYDGNTLKEKEKLQEIFEVWTDRGRVIIDVSASLDLTDMCRLVSFADSVLWCVGPDDKDAAIAQIKALEEKVHAWREKISLIWVLAETEHVCPVAPEIVELVNRDFKVNLSPQAENCGIQLHHGIERIVHELRGIRIGIALGGGAAQGMANLGVLKTLEENGIVVDMIAGTSAGAMTGTTYAAGLEVDYSVGKFVKDLTPSWLLRKLPHGGHWYLLYKYRTRQFDRMLRKYLDGVRLEQMPIPMHTITVDLVSGEAVVREKGDAVNAIVESINLPVLSSPIRRPGEALVDGGLINNIPADVLVKKGCNFVIAVSVTAKLEKEFAQIRPNSKKISRWRPSILQTILRGYQVQSFNMNAVGVQPADFVIEPEVLKFGLTEFTRTDELADAGSCAALKALPEIKRLLSQLDKKLFPASS